MTHACMYLSKDGVLFYESQRDKQLSETITICGIYVYEKHVCCLHMMHDEFFFQGPWSSGWKS